MSGTNICFAQDIKNKTLEVFGTDPQAYQDCEEFFSVKFEKTMPPPRTIALLDKLFNRLKEGDTPESAECDKFLNALEKTTVPDNVFVWMKNMAEFSKKNINAKLFQVDNSKVKDQFSAGNMLYESGKFEDASKKYMEIIKDHPGHLDARNNYGLAMMHLGYNMVPLLHFMTVAELSPKYTGAKINAALIVKRMGLDDEAYKMMSECAAVSPEAPIVNYNIAWFENSRGNYSESKKYLDRILKNFPTNKKTKILSALNSIEMGEKYDISDETCLKDSQWKELAESDFETLEISSPQTVVQTGDIETVTLNKGDKYLISEKKGDQIAVYYSKNEKKMRGWIKLNKEPISEAGSKPNASSDKMAKAESGDAPPKQNLAAQEEQAAGRAAVPDAPAIGRTGSRSEEVRQNFKEQISKQDEKLINAIKKELAGLIINQIKAGANVNIADKSGQTALMVLAARGTVDDVKLIVEKGADVKATNKAGMTPLLIAVRAGSSDIVSYLIEKNANPNDATPDGKTALEIARKQNDEKIIEILMRAGAR